VLPRAPAPGLTHAFPACSPAPSHPLRRIPLPRPPPGTRRLQGGASCPLRRTRAIAPLAPRAPVWRQPPRGSAPTPSSVAIPSYPPSPVVSTNDSPRCQYLDHPWPIIWCARVSRACRSSGASTGSCHRGVRGAPGHATTRAASAGAPSLSIGPRPWRPPPASRRRDL